MGVVVVVTERKLSTALQALTAAALALPLLSTVQADDALSFQYGHYQEGKRQLFGGTSLFHPIEVDSLQSNAHVRLADRLKFIFNYSQDTWSGATPIAVAPALFQGNRAKYNSDGVITSASPYIQSAPDTMYFDKQGNPLGRNTDGSFSKVPQLVSILSSASPEVRKQSDFNLGYEWDEAAVNMGGGISLENDYESRFANFGGHWDFNQKLTTIDAGLSYTYSETKALLDHDATPYIEKSSYDGRVAVAGGTSLLHGQREDWKTHWSMVQVLNKEALIETGVSYTHSAGYMANPYKVTEIVFIDPAQQAGAFGETEALYKAFLEQRPNERNQWTANLRYVQHIDSLNAALHADYSFFHDDWGVNAHTFELNWGQPLADNWTLTPRLRYYSQDGASFYHPYIVSNQAYSKNAVDNQGREVLIEADNPNNGKHYFRDADYNVVDTQGNSIDPFALNLINQRVGFNAKKLPPYYSSDQRLSSYGALSGGVTLSKRFAKGISLEVDGEYYAHVSDLTLGGGGAGSYTDFDYYAINAALKIDLGALSLGSGSMAHSHHHQHIHHHGSHAPAGVMFDHTLKQAGDFMVGYRYMYSDQADTLLHRSHSVSDSRIVQQGCGAIGCSVTPSQMTMHMHMLDLMLAPTDWLTLMLMPQFMDMSMDMRKLSGAPDFNSLDDATQAAVLHSGHEHTTGGIGDTGIYALFKLFANSTQQLHLTAGFSAPTADAGIKLRNTHGQEAGFIHYGMQLGSGTWDIKPSITYSAQVAAWSYGAQLSGTSRLGQRNSSGFALGDMLQASAWGHYAFTDWLSSSLRGVYTVQGKNVGKYNDTYHRIGPMDYAGSYGGRYVDVGFGLSVTVPTGDWQGNRFSVEWLQPVDDEVNGYQLERTGTLAATWGIMF